MHMNFHLAFEKEGVPEDKRETIFRYGETTTKALLICNFDTHNVDGKHTVHFFLFEPRVDGECLLSLSGE